MEYLPSYQDSLYADIHRAQRLTDEIMANNFKKLSPEKRQLISDSIMDYNSAKVRQDRRSTASRRKALVKDTAAAYVQKYDQYGYYQVGMEKYGSRKEKHRSNKAG